MPNLPGYEVRPADTAMKVSEIKDFYKNEFKRVGVALKSARERLVILSRNIVRTQINDAKISELKIAINKVTFKLLIVIINVCREKSLVQ